MDDAEIKQDKERAAIQQQEFQKIIDGKGYTLYQQVMTELANIDKRRRNLKPRAIYLGSEELRILRAWSGGRPHWYVSQHGETFAGYPTYRVGEQSHFYIAWE
jgi:hypothetical protein